MTNYDDYIDVLSEHAAQYCSPELAPMVSDKMAEVAMGDPRAANYAKSNDRVALATVSPRWNVAARLAGE